MARMKFSSSRADYLEAQIDEPVKIEDVIHGLEENRNDELEENRADTSKKKKAKNLIATYMYLDHKDGFDRVTSSPVFKTDSRAPQEPPKTKKGYKVVIREAETSSIVLTLRSSPSAKSITSDGDLKVKYPHVGQLIDMLYAIDGVCG